MTKKSAVNATKTTRRNYLPLGGVFTRIVLFSTLALCTALTFTSCENFLNGADFKKQLEEDIAYAKAESVSFTVLPVNITQGQVTSDVISAKVGYPVEISFEANTAYGNFLEWQAYSNYSYDEASQTILGERLGEDEISFEDSYKSTTKMTVHSPVKNIRIVPAVVPNPYIWFDSPSYTEGDIVYSVGKITPSGRSAINTQNTLSLTAESYSGYAIKNWRIQTPDGQVLKDLQAFYNDGENNIDVTKSFFGFSDDFTPSQNPLFTFNSASISDDQSSSSVLVTANTAAVEGCIFTPVCVTRPKVLSVNPDVSQKISRTQTITFTFNRELNKSSVDVRVRSFSPSDSDFKIDDTIYNKPTVSGKTITLTTKKTVAADTQIEITLLPLIADSEGITLGESKIYTFTTSNVTDIMPPEISGANLSYYSAETSKLTTAYVSESTRNAPATASHAVNGSRFRIRIDATDANTGNSGIQGYKITERVVELTENIVISVNDGILDYKQETDDNNLYLVPIGGKSLYDSNGNWNGKWLSDVEQSRFYKESSYSSGSINYDAIAIGGIHQISVQAVDNAGNISVQKDFFVQFAGEAIEKDQILIAKKEVFEGSDCLRLMPRLTAFDKWKNSGVKFFVRINNEGEFIDLKSPFWRDATFNVNGSGSVQTKILYWQPKTMKKNTSGDLTLFRADGYGIPFSVNAYDYRSVTYPTLTASFENFYISPANLGDIILLNKSNGKVFVKSAQEFAEEESSATPLAVVVYADNKHIWGMGLEISEPLQWCSSSCKGANFNFSDKNLNIYINADINSGGSAEPDADLQDDWIVIKKYDPTGAANPAANYPAFNYCLTYGTDVLSLNPNSTNANIKALAGEWCMINKYIGYDLANITWLRDSYSLLGVTDTFSDYWCSSAYTTEAVYTTNYTSTSTINKTSTKYVRPVFDFFDMLSE